MVIDPVAGSGTTIIAAMELNRKAYGFEIKKTFYKEAKDLIDVYTAKKREIEELGFARTEIQNKHPILF